MDKKSIDTESAFVKKEAFEDVVQQLRDTEQHLNDMELKYNALEKEERDNVAVTQLTPDSEPENWSPTQPITLWSAGRNYMDISFNGLFSAGASTDEDVQTLFGGGHDPNQRGFTLQQLETTFEGAVDPYFHGQANIIFQIDSEGESFLEVEEAFLTSMSLPLNLQAKAGTFFTEFGRFNETHPHSWDFIDQPLVNNRFFGGDGLRNPGARIAWLAPAENYNELIPLMKKEGVKLIIIEPFREHRTSEFVADKTGAKVIAMPIMPGGQKETEDYLSLFDYNIDSLISSLK
ncbi:MAG: zinc ABC transporter substrate-binding protein [Planctomycetes bacterium]|nr:zinc ABC transporter substrate-binding protein [Planctomycetota bacterium]